ncbi:Uncharacterised protein [Mycobacterium tuberculosis]|uniref:Uncharacterized protein n=1 Tax=Mycobacterium tuberculosis TaxID=1773 RepID=A0A0U0QYY0_MYCTX|nr:Uncharacterised protein [Mycobacterium tuberculosis]CKS30085.1 Uncharacterised protein [Mycobacterium tuberculosis]CNM59681.1 Uncharacterised protein [Mycobacterium tuberculosis]CNT90151.1 Uncharacterised protein [Mycobacterium tuberculosis]CNT95687.1 Uncharacterised protein [Mycobacterium tuberculosis]
MGAVRAGDIVSWHLEHGLSGDRCSHAMPLHHLVQGVQGGLVVAVAGGQSGGVHLEHRRFPAIAGCHVHQHRRPRYPGPATGQQRRRDHPIELDAGVVEAARPVAKLGGVVSQVCLEIPGGRRPQVGSDVLGVPSLQGLHHRRDLGSPIAGGFALADRQRQRCRAHRLNRWNAKTIQPCHVGDPGNACWREKGLQGQPGLVRASDAVGAVPVSDRRRVRRP